MRSKVSGDFELPRINPVLQDLSLCRFKAYFRVIKEVQLPPYSGSTLRGLLGNALRKVKYGIKKSCPECRNRSDCRYNSLYAFLFESPCDHPFLATGISNLPPRLNRDNYPQPFILDPPEGGFYEKEDILTLPFTLIGKGVEFFPFMVCAFKQFSSLSIGKAQGRIALESIVNDYPPDSDEETLIYDSKIDQIVGPGEVVNFPQVKEWVENALPSDAPIEKIYLRFLTPFRYKHENKLGDPLNFGILMRNLLRRIDLLSIYSPLTFNLDHQALISMADQVTIDRSIDSQELTWIDFDRYSSRQGDWMKMGGYVGDIVFSGPMTTFLPYLKMGEFLHIGKNVSFGLGKYEMAVVSSLK